MSNDLPDIEQSFTGQVQAMFYFLDEPATTLTIQFHEQAITARAFGQVALDLRVELCGATICATLHHVQPDCPQIIAFTVIPS